MVLGALSLVAIVANRRHRQEMARLQTLATRPEAPNWPGPAEVAPARQAAIEYARSILRTPYDPLMGMYGDPLGRVGLVVCIDVPIRAYQAGGVSLPLLLKDTARAHPEIFDIGPNNSPSNPFFFRRVRNYAPLFQRHPLLLSSKEPRPGDMAFYGGFHIALVIEVRKDGSFDVIEASPRKGHVAVSDGAYMERTWGKPAFFGRIRDGGTDILRPHEVVRMVPLFK